MDIKKILLLNPPGSKLYQRLNYCSSISKAYYYFHPLDLLVLSGTISANYDIEVIDAIAENISPDRCLRLILDKDPDAIIFLTSALSWDEDISLINEVKSKKDILAIASGGIVEFNGIEIMKNNNSLDAIILDFTSKGIIDFLENKPSKVNNMIIRKNSEIVAGNGHSGIYEFDIPIPRHELFPLRRYRIPYFKSHPVTLVLVSYGCPFKCTFCSLGLLRYKVRDINNIIDELKYIKKLGIKEVAMVDSCFGANREYAIKLCEILIKNNLKFGWATTARADTLDRELLNIMKRSGCHTVLLGVESGSDIMLNKIQKNFSTREVIEAFKLAKEMGIRTHAFFMIGLPGEDAKAIEKTINFARRLDCDYASFSFPFPEVGTPLREEAIKNDWFVNNKKSFFSSFHPTIRTSEISEKELLQLMKKAIKSFYLRPSYLKRRIFSVRSLHELKSNTMEGISLFANLLNMPK